jgi:hypothetical protein
MKTIEVTIQELQAATRQKVYKGNGLDDSSNKRV